MFRPLRTVSMCRPPRSVSRVKLNADVSALKLETSPRDLEWTALGFLSVQEARVIIKSPHASLFTAVLCVGE